MKKKTASEILLALLLIGMLTLAFNIELVKADPTTWTVDDDGPANFSSIQEAINNPQVVGGDTIFVHNGTYYENVVVDKSLKLIGESRDAIISQNYTYATLEVCADDVIIKEFTVQHITHPYTPPPILCGILLYSSSNCEVRDNKVEPSGYTGIVVDGGSGNKIVDNDVESSTSYGIEVTHSHDNLIMKNTMNAYFYPIWLVDSNFNHICYNSLGIHWHIICLSLLRSNNNTIEGNLFYDSGYQSSPHIELLQSSNNSIFHNSFDSSNPGVFLDENSTNNVWDNCYPSGGNYWSDYTGLDLYSGPYQNETGSDGIGDTPYYIIDANNTDNYPLVKPYIPSDIGITTITTSKTVVGQGYNLNITIKILNYGTNTETFNLTTYANTTIIQTITNVVVTSRNSTTITFTWNTTGWSKGNYTISAHATPLPGETETADNALTDGTIIVTIPGDVDGDFDVDIYDVVLVMSIYGSKQGDSLYNPNMDLWWDDVINIYDMVICTSHYGQKDP